MWLVNAALRNPYSVYVGMLLVTVLGIVAYQRTPTDILPQIKMPVVVVFASYRGMPAPDMEKSVTAVLERALTRCDHLEHIESRSLLGIGIIKVYFRPQVDPDVAASQVISLVNGEMQFMPPGMLPPTILKLDASSIPVGNLVISSDSRDDKELLDLADHAIREQLAGIEGLASAPVFGGVFRQVQIYVNPRSLEALKLSPNDVARKVNAQSQVIPTGEIRIGPPDKGMTYYVSSNSMVGDPKDFAKIPIASDGNKIVYLGDVATILDASRWRTNTVHVNGKRAVYMPLLRQAGASAVDVVDNVQAFLPTLHKRGYIPEDVEVEVVFDQSQYVRDALTNLRLEGLLGAGLAALVVLLFLGSLRGMLVVALSIPLSVLAAFLGLYFTGHTLNIMTLGGLALILGRVVDDSIVDVENTVRHLGMDKSPEDAARDSAAEIATPVLMATITTVVVFFPLVFISGVGKYLFTPLAVSATLAMAASYLVSRTVSPLFCARLLRGHHHPEHFPLWLFLPALAVAIAGLGVPALVYWAPDLLPAAADGLGALLPHLSAGVRMLIVGTGLVGAVIVLVAVVYWCAPAFERASEKFTAAYERILRFCLRRRVAVVALVLAGVVPAVWCYRRLGQELFPEVDSSEFTVHLRAKGGPRVETTERQIREIDQLVRAVVPAEDLQLTLANIGISSRWSAIYTSNNGPHAAFLRVQLRSGFDGRHTPTLEYVEKLRERLKDKYPGDDFFFETGGMIRQILNGGAAAPIEVQVHGRDMVARRKVAHFLDARISRITQVKDTYLPQAMDLPQLKIDVDRTAAARLNLDQADVIRNVITALMSSAQLAPNFWIDPQSGNPYVIGVQYPEPAVKDIQTLENIPLSRERGRSTTRVPLVRDVAKIVPAEAPVEVYRYDVDTVSQLFVSVGDNDIAGVAGRVERVVHELPLEYAASLAPPGKLTEHALAALKAEGNEFYEDRDFRQDLADYYTHPTPERRTYLRDWYEIDPEELNIFRSNEEFRERMLAYFKKPRERTRAKIVQDYGIDPEPLKMPRNVRVEVRGEITNMRESFREMAFNLALAVLLVYLVMAAQFSSWLDPLIMIVAAPLGLIGVAVTLWATGTSLNIQSLMGVLLMVGISVSNSVLVVEFANRLREEGKSTLEAIVGAARTRMRPILMTTLATVAGLLPLAIHRHPGDEMNLPLARAVIGGLAGSTVLTLFVVPVLYLLLKPRRAAKKELQIAN